MLDQGGGAQRPDEQLLGEDVRGGIHLYTYVAGLRRRAGHQEMGKPVQPGVGHAGQHLIGDRPEPLGPEAHWSIRVIVRGGSSPR